MASRAIERVKELLEEHPTIDWREENGGIVVDAGDETGFTVRFVEDKSGEFVVGYDFWHEHFDDLDEAIKCFRFGLSDGGRLMVTQRGGFRYKWLLQFRESGDWVDEQETGLFFFPFWRRKQVFFLQNKWLSWP